MGDLDIEDKEVAVSKDTVIGQRQRSAGLRVGPRKIHLSQKQVLISIDARHSEIRQLLQRVATKAGVNLVISDSVSGYVSLRLRNVPWKKALESIAAAKGYRIKPVQRGWMVN